MNISAFRISAHSARRAVSLMGLVLVAGMSLAPALAGSSEEAQEFMRRNNSGKKKVSQPDVSSDDSDSALPVPQPRGEAGEGTRVAAGSPVSGTSVFDSNAANGFVTAKDTHAPPLPKGKATTQTEVFGGKVVSPMLMADSADKFDEAVSRFTRIAQQGGWPKVDSIHLKNGSSGEEVVALKKHLFMEGYLDAKEMTPAYVAEFTDGTQAAVERYQNNHGLVRTGRVDKATVAELNVSANQRLATMRANQPRLKVYSADLADRLIVMNIPAAQLETIENGRVFSRHNVVDGRQSRPSPVVMSSISEINFNPYWNAPQSIVEKDLIPRILRNGVRALSDEDIKVYDGHGGPEIDVSEVDWENTPANRYFFRQDPGKHNAMARMKVTFKSPFGVYMHDTPQKKLFRDADRFESSGCARIEKVDVMVNWILAGQDGWSAEKIDSMAESLEQIDVPVQNPPQLRWVYLTSWVDSSGLVHFRNDIYDMDGSDFVLGQPLPVGVTTSTGARFILKPIGAQAPVVDPT